MTGFNNFKVATVKNLHTWLNNIDNTVIIGTQSDKTLRKIDITDGNYATYSPNADTTGVYISGYSVGDGKQAYTDDQNVIVQDIEYRIAEQLTPCQTYSYSATVTSINGKSPDSVSDSDLCQSIQSGEDVEFEMELMRTGTYLDDINMPMYVGPEKIEDDESYVYGTEFTQTGNNTYTFRIVVDNLPEGNCVTTKTSAVVYSRNIQCGDDPIITPDDVCDALAVQGSTVSIISESLEAYCNNISLNTVDSDIAILVRSSYYPSGAKSTTALSEGFSVVMEDAPANWDGTTSIAQTGYITKTCVGHTYQFPFTYTRIPCSPLYIKTVPCIQHGITPQRGTHYFVYKNGELDSNVTATATATSDSIWTINATDGSDTATSVLTVCPYFTMSYNTINFNGTPYNHSTYSGTNIQGPGQDPSYGDTLTFTVTPSDTNSILQSIEVEVLGDNDLGTNTIKKVFKPTVLPNGTSVVFSDTETASGAATISVSGNRKSATVTIQNITGSLRILGIANSGSDTNCIHDIQVVNAVTDQQIASYRMIDNVYQQGYENAANGSVIVGDSSTYIVYNFIGDYYSFDGLECGSTKIIQAVEECDIETNIYYGSVKQDTLWCSSSQLVNGTFAIPEPDTGSGCTMSYTNPRVIVDAENMSVQYDDTNITYSGYSRTFEGLKISPSNVICGQSLDIYLTFSYDDVSAEKYVSPLGKVEIGGTTQTFTVSNNYIIKSVSQNNQNCEFTRDGTNVTITFNTPVDCTDDIYVDYDYESSACNRQAGYPKTWYDESSITPVKLNENLNVSGDTVDFTYGTSGDLYFTATQHTHILYENDCQSEVNEYSTVTIGGATKKSTDISNGVITMTFGITGKWSENGEAEEKTFTVTFGVA